MMKASKIQKWELLIGGALILIFILFMIFRPAVKPAAAPDSAKEVEQIKATDKEVKQVTDSAKVIALMRDTIRQLKIRLEKTVAEKSKADQEVTRLVVAVKELPPEIVSPECDSLASAVVILQDINRQSDLKYDSVIVAHEKTDRLQVIQSDRQQQLYAQLRASASGLLADVQSLNKALNKANKKVKGQRFLGRLTGVVAAAAIGLLLTK